MKITDISQVTPISCISPFVIVDCIHESIKDGIGNRYEIFLLNRDNEIFAHFESNKCISVTALDT